MAEMTLAQFEVVAELMRSHQSVRTAVRMVLVEDSVTGAAAVATGLSPNSVSNALRRYRNVHKKLLLAYSNS